MACTYPDAAVKTDTCLLGRQSCKQRWPTPGNWTVAESCPQNIDFIIAEQIVRSAHQHLDRGRLWLHFRCELGYRDGRRVQPREVDIATGAAEDLGREAGVVVGGKYGVAACCHRYPWLWCCPTRRAQDDGVARKMCNWKRDGCIWEERFEHAWSPHPCG